MGVYVVKMDGEKVRTFRDVLLAKAWATKHCRGVVEIVSLKERELPRATKMPWCPNMDMPDLRYKPFTSLN